MLLANGDPPSAELARAVAARHDLLIAIDGAALRARGSRIRELVEGVQHLKPLAALAVELRQRFDRAAIAGIGFHGLAERRTRSIGISRRKHYAAAATVMCPSKRASSASTRCTR